MAYPIPEKGKSYAKKDFGIANPENQRSDHFVNGELYSFFTLHDKSGLRNKFELDGFVYQARRDYQLIDRNKTASVCRHVFVRENPQDAAFTYHGKALAEKRHSDDQNKIFL